MFNSRIALRHARAVVVAAAVLTIGCAPSDGPETETGSGSANQALALAPDTQFDTVEGGTASIRDLRGNVVVVNFWGTWCVPCRREIPELVELHEAYEGRPVEIVGIAVDSGDAEDIREFADGFGVEYRLWIAGMETVMSEFEAVGYPFTLIIDQDGGIVSSFYGPQTLASLSGEIDALLP